MNKLKTLFLSIIIALAVAAIAFAWTNPSGNPPSGGGALYYSGGSVGIGTTEPAEKLEVSGNIKLSGATATYKITNLATPTAVSDAANKAYVDAATAIKTWYRTATTANGAAASTLCAAGYHMCYPGEWVSRRWDSTLGDAGDTWGAGAWVDIHINSYSRYRGDCNSYTTADPTLWGTTAKVHSNSIAFTTATGWLYFAVGCESVLQAFCCQD